MVVLLLLAWLQAGDEPVSFSPQEIVKIMTHRIKPLPADATNRVADDASAAHFGQMLFFEARFSSNGLISCASCHVPAKAFTDGLQLSKGQVVLERHTPSILNSAFQRWQFWDGRNDSQWSQALGPFEEEREFGGNRLSILHLVARDETLHAAYQHIFGPLPPLDQVARFPEAALPLPGHPNDPRHLAWLAMSAEDREAATTAFANLGKAIAAYERRILSRDAPFDRFASALEQGGGEGLDQLSVTQQRGLKLFIGKARCRNCHAGPNFSDSEFHNTGVPPLQGSLPKDAGRYEGIPKLLENPFRADGPYSDDKTGAAAQRLRYLQHRSDQWGQFKTPSLREIAETAPYMHMGQMQTLEEVVDFYNTLDKQVRLGHHQDPLLMPLELSSFEVADLVAFLKSLSGAPLEDELLHPPKAAQ